MPFVSKEVRKMLEFYQVKYHRSSPYYPQGNGQVEAKNKTLIKIISKMSQENSGGWVAHLPNSLWAYQSSPKFATGFCPISFVYGTKVVSRGNDTVLEGYANVKEGKREGSLYSRKVRGPGRIR